MRRRRATRSALALLLCASPVFPQPAQTPAGVVAALSFDRPGPDRTLPSDAPTATPPTAPVRLRSGFVPEACRARQVLDDPTLVDCWLEQFPRVAAAIRWEFVDTRGPRARAWPDWDEDAR